MNLQEYKKKRDFKATPEPEASVKKSKDKLSFVIQRHKATRLHYDFRLEMDGVLKSWAVPKGPSLNPKDKRLAMMVEDHPYDYKDFKGMIPEGHYGAGIVEIWDKGTYTDLEKDDKKRSEKTVKAGLKAGNLKFHLQGKKLKGEFALVKLKGKDDNAWLLIKHNDEYALHSEYNSEEDTPKTSPINKWLQEHDKPVKKAAGKKVTTKEPAPAKRTDNNKPGTLNFGKIEVKTTNLNKIYWPKEKYTKGDVINYYQQVADYILPYLKERPESLLRNINGINEPAFFQKDAGSQAPDWIKRVPVYSESTGKDIDYIICNDKATLAYLNNLGCIELNPWNSTIQKPDHPDYMIVDIDPSKKNTFNQVIEAANVIKQILDKAGAESFCKTSGASGLHIFVPMAKKYTYEQVKNFCLLICTMAQEQLPGFTTLERNLKKRGDNHIYMDYLQNRRGQTISSVYSVRPKPGATVSTPLLWKEVKAGLTPAQFDINSIHKRLKKMGDIFAGVLGKGADMKKCLKLLET